MFENLQNIIPKITHHLNINSQLVSASICTFCRQILQADYPELAKYIQVVSFSNNTVKIKGANNLILEEIRYMKADLICKVNYKIQANPLLASNKVTEIQVITG
jgi:hypothetical protein